MATHASPTTAPRPPAAISNFAIDPSVTAWNVPAREWLTRNNKDWDGLASGSVVFNRAGQVLLIQRASHDSMPNRWEIPGGAVDADDPTVLYGAARELWEEAGLVATRARHVVSEGPDRPPGHVFTNRTGKKFFCRFVFAVDVESCDEVRLDPNEHQDYAWVSEEEVRAQRIGDRDIPITHPTMRATILESFRLQREAAGCDVR